MQHIITISSFLFFTALVAFITWLMTRKEDVKSKEGYFLAGRSLTYPFIAGSLLLTNLSTEQMVGLNGSAFKYGLCVMAWEVVAVLALVAMAMFFLPRFLKSGIATLPEYLHIRFDRTTAIITNIIFLIAYMLILLPIILYTGATGLSGIMDVPSLTGLSSESANLWLMVWFVGVVGMVYALFGGLRSVAVSDTLNGVGLIHVMGRDSGFIAAYASLANTHVNYCLIPEEKFTLEEGENAFLPSLFKRLQARHHAVVIVAEGAGQDLIDGERETDKSGNILHHNIGMFLKDKIREYSKKTGIEAQIKYFDPTYSIRGVPANGTDAVFCFLLAQNAVHAAMMGCTDMVVGHWSDSFTHVPIEMSTKERKKIDTNGLLWRSVRMSTWPEYR